MGISVPTGLSVANTPITTNGTIAISFATGYSIPTTEKQGQWDTAYTNRITSLTTTGSGAASLTSNTLNIPTYALPLAADGTMGGIQMGFSASGANVPLQLSYEKAFVAITKTAIEAALSRSSNSGSGSQYPILSIKNTLATQGDGASTYNFSALLLSSGNEAVNMYLTTSYADGSWFPQGIINVSSNHPLIFKTNNIERFRLANSGEGIFASTVQATENIFTRLTIPSSTPTGMTAGRWYFSIV